MSLAADPQGIKLDKEVRTGNYIIVCLLKIQWNVRPSAVVRPDGEQVSSEEGVLQSCGPQQSPAKRQRRPTGGLHAQQH